MTETIVRLVGFSAGLHGLAKYAKFKEMNSGYFLFGAPEDAIVGLPTYLDVWVLLPGHSYDWQNLAWVLCGALLMYFSKQIARVFPSRGS